MSAYYPEEEIRNALLLKNNNPTAATAVGSSSASSAHPHPHVCHPSSRDDRVPALWRYFPLVVLDPCVAKITLDEEPSLGWSVGRNLWCGCPEEFTVIDADIVDAKQRLYQVRIIVHDADHDRGMGYWGLVFDRNDTNRVLATINCVGDTESCIDETDVMANGCFEDHKCLQVLRKAVSDRPGLVPASETQFEMLLSFAMEAASSCSDHKVFPKNDFPKQRLMLKLLGKADDGGENADNLAATILSQSGPIQDRIAQYSAEEPYVMCADGLEDGVDKSLDWFKEEVMQLLQAWELFDKGYDDLQAAVSSILDWEVHVAEDSVFFKRKEGRGGGATRPSPVYDYFNRDNLVELRADGSLDDDSSPFRDNEGNLDKTLIAEYMENFVKPVTMWIREDGTSFLLREKSARGAASSSSSSPAKGEEEEENSSTRKKRKKVQDSGYFLYFQNARPTIKEENPDASFGDIAVLIRARFEALPADQKKIWVDKAVKGDH